MRVEFQPGKLYRASRHLGYYFLDESSGEILKRDLSNYNILVQDDIIMFLHFFKENEAEQRFKIPYHVMKALYRNKVIYLSFKNPSCHGLFEKC